MLVYTLASLAHWVWAYCIYSTPLVFHTSCAYIIHIYYRVYSQPLCLYILNKIKLLINPHITCSLSLDLYPQMYYKKYAILWWSKFVAKTYKSPSPTYNISPNIYTYIYTHTYTHGYLKIGGLKIYNLIIW